MAPNTNFELFLQQYYQHHDENVEAIPPLTKLLDERTPEQELGHRLWNSLLQGNREYPECCDGHRDLIEALQKIIILNGDRQHQSWLNDFNGTLYDLPEALIRHVKTQAPVQFSARVADFNDNLFYQMQSQKGLQHLGLAKLQNGLLEGQANDALGSFLNTDSTVPQPPHVDYTWEILEEHGGELQLGFFPLTEEGMFLQVWPTQPPHGASLEKSIHGQIIYIPYGKLLVLPATTIHGGGFRTSANGNLRFHLYLSHSKLPDHQTNKYTEPNDKSRELSERYINAPYMEELLEHLFV
uniref:Uncharacterized protein n=1 Tax=Ditylum brightwellii TaxID=49249 RepID=A0A7S4T7Z9_9STRA